MIKKEKMIQRIYRISKEDDKLVKKNSKRLEFGEAEYIRDLIRKDNVGITR